MTHHHLTADMAAERPECNGTSAIALCESCNCYPCACGGERKTMEAPERITLMRRVGADEWHLRAQGETMSWGNSDSASYIRADVVDRSEQRLSEIPDALIRRISKLEAALKLIAAKKHPEQEDHPYQATARAALEATHEEQ